MTDLKVDPTTLFAPIEAAVVNAFAVRSGAKALASLRPLMWLAYLALAQAFGLAHLITPEMRAIAIDAARRPGRRKVESDGQASLLDMFPINDGRPGVYVSFVRLRVGNVRELSGDAVLDLFGCHEPSTAIVRAYEQGWVGGPSGNGLRFIPPTIWGLVQDHNSAGFARNGGVDEYIAALESTIKQWSDVLGTTDPEEAIHIVDTMKQSIAESARLPTVEVTKEPCPHKSVVLFDDERKCTACGEVLPKLQNEKTTKLRKNAHAKLTANEEPREQLPLSHGTGIAARAKTTARTAKRLGSKTSTSKKGRAS